MTEIASHEWDVLNDASAADKPQAFVRYAQKIIEAKEAGALTMEDAGYNICAAIFIDELMEVPELAEAIDIGCDLELPPAHRSIKNEGEGWARLKKLIHDYASGTRHGVEQRVQLTATKHDAKGHMIASWGGWIDIENGQIAIRTGEESTRQAIEKLISAAASGLTDGGHLQDIQQQLDGRDIAGYRITTELQEHLGRDGHAEYHSANAFCGNAGDEEMSHLYDLVAGLSDDELRSLAGSVGLKLRTSSTSAPTREDYESIIDEADREDFYREYRRLRPQA